MSNRISNATSLGALFWRGEGSGDHIGWLAGASPTPTNATPRFETLHAAAQGKKLILPPGADDCVYLFAGGLFSNLIPPSLYLAENMSALRRAGLDTRRIPLATNQSVETNARSVRAAVLEAARGGKKVVILGHSKGGLDSAAAIAMYPEVAAVARALVTIQSPYGGSPIADDVHADPLQSALNASFVLATGGSPQCVRDLRHETRRAFIAKHPLPPGLPVVSLATVDDAFFSSTSMTGRYLRDRYGARSDGLVVVSEALVPGSRAVIIEGVDHLSTVSPTHQRKRFTPASITLVLVAMALE